MLHSIRCFELKRAGFPQPEKEVNQIWYNIGGDPCIMRMKMWPDRMLLVAAEFDSTSFTIVKNMLDDSFAYCPKVEDFLIELNELDDQYYWTIQSPQQENEWKWTIQKFSKVLKKSMKTVRSSHLMEGLFDCFIEEVG